MESKRLLKSGRGIIDLNLPSSKPATRIEAVQVLEACETLESSGANYLTDTRMDASGK